VLLFGVIAGASLLSWILLHVGPWLVRGAVLALTSAGVVDAEDPFYTITPRDHRWCHDPWMSYINKPSKIATIVTYVDAASRSHPGVSNLVYSARALGWGNPVLLGSAEGHDTPLLGTKDLHEWQAWLRRAKEYAKYASSRPGSEVLVYMDAFDTLLVGGPEAFVKDFEELQRAEVAADALRRKSMGKPPNKPETKKHPFREHPPLVPLKASQVVVLGAERLCDTTDCRRNKLKHFKARMEARAATHASVRTQQMVKEGKLGADAAGRQEAHDFETRLGSQFRYINAGVLVGRADALAAFLWDAVSVQTMYRIDDQSAYMRLGFVEFTDVDFNRVQPQGFGRYGVALDYESQLVGVVSPAASHLEHDWSNLNSGDLTLETTEAAAAGASDALVGSAVVEKGAVVERGRQKAKEKETVDPAESAVLVRRLTRKAPSIIHVAGVRYRGSPGQRMNPCQVLLLKAYNLLLDRLTSKLEGMRWQIKALRRANKRNSVGLEEALVPEDAERLVAESKKMFAASSSSPPPSSSFSGGGGVPIAPSSALRRPEKKLRVVVSLTTTPGRINLLKPTLNSLAAQTLKPDRVILNVPLFSTRFNKTYEVPSWLLQRAPFVHVNRCEHDYGPATKLIPTLTLEPHGSTLIITVDDEYAYPPVLVESLVRAHLSSPHSAFGFAGQMVDLSPDSQWRPPRRIEHEEYVETFGGIELPQILKQNGEFVKVKIFPPPNSLPVDPKYAKHAAPATDQGARVKVRGGNAGLAIASHFGAGIYDLVKVRLRVRSADTAEYHTGPVAVDILEAFLGAIYRRSHFDLASLLGVNASDPLRGRHKACATTDDIVFSAHLASRGIPRVKLPMLFERPRETAADAVSPLRHDNVGGASNNDVCAASLLLKLQTWPWLDKHQVQASTFRDSDRRAGAQPCAVGLTKLPLPAPAKVEAAYTPRADYENSTRSPCNMDAVALSTLPRPCATVASFAAAHGGEMPLLPDQILLSADFPLQALGFEPEDRSGPGKAPYVGLPLPCSFSDSGGGGSGSAGPAVAMDDSFVARGDTCLLWHNNDTLKKATPFLPMSSAQDAVLKKKRPKLRSLTRGGVSSAQGETGAAAALAEVRAGLQNGLPPPGAFMLWNHDHGLVAQYQRFGADLSDAASCRPAGWGEWAGALRGKNKVWEVRSPLRYTPKPYMKYPVQQRAVLSVNSAGSLQLRPGLPWAALGAPTFSTDSSPSSVHADGSSSHGSGLSLPAGYHAVARLHRSGILCVVAEPKLR